MKHCGISTEYLGSIRLESADVKEFIYKIEEEIKKHEQFEIKVEHDFADGLYARKILIPRGVCLTGKVHKQNDLNIMVYGDITVLTEMGLRRLKGYNIFPGKAGLKQFGIAHSDSLWVTIHHTHKTDLDEVEAELFEDEERVFDFKTGKVCQSWLAKQDYQRVLEESGISEERAWLETVNESDRTECENTCIRVDTSAIHGLGVFAATDIPDGFEIGLATIDGRRTRLGRYTNHSHKPNAFPVSVDGSITFYALGDISTGQEITVDYRNTLSLNGRMKEVACPV